MDDSADEKIFMEDPIWFSPINVIHHVHELSIVLNEKQKNSKEFKKVIEANVTALMLMGLMKINGEQYWMQIVDDNEQSPDIRTINYSSKKDEKFDFMDQEDVEVVEYESHSAGNIPDFPASTKFKKTKGYDSKTHILCHFGEGVVLNIPSEKDLKKQMEVIDSKSPIVVLVEMSKSDSTYKLVQLNPQVRDLVEFKLKEEIDRLVKNGYIGVYVFKKGSRKPVESKPDEKHYPFEKVGYVPNAQGAY